ncbi:hypothetical protein HMPREF1143_0265 [Peptoanaerobacter stomatis]|uniref:Uncharacterized protein n=1 Tax=Peptoanaerobacter stomatis TaxID=796937 RepID=J4W660_9FIRM|nr:hypothetical protein HMPREF1143_0265 [Peptoanaerobacter stomatis]
MLLYLKKYIQFFQGKILPLYINLTFRSAFNTFFEKFIFKRKKKRQGA